MDSPYLTMPEKRGLLENIRELVKGDVLTLDDRNAIFEICLHACERELAKEKEIQE